jgi:hypothetical protein
MILDTLFGMPLKYNRVATTYIDFHRVQNVRIFIISLLIVLMGLIIFVIAKLIFVYFIAWAVFFMLLALVMISCASGRQVVEKKLLQRLNEQETGKTPLKQLPIEGRTDYWRTAIRLYSIALPYYCMCLVLFYYKPLTLDIACELSYLKCSADAKNSTTIAEARQECLTTRKSCPIPN